MCVLPPNTATILQPMDQGIFTILKRFYRQNIMRRALSDEFRNSSMKEVLKTISIKDAIGWSAQAWQNVSAETIRSSWNTLSTNICEPCQSQPSSDTFERSSVDLSDGNPIETLNLKSNVLSNTILPTESVHTSSRSCSIIR